jgi:hypothetical protein
MNWIASRFKVAFEHLRAIVEGAMPHDPLFDTSNDVCRTGGKFTWENSDEISIRRYYVSQFVYIKFHEDEIVFSFDVQPNCPLWEYDTEIEIVRVTRGSVAFRLRTRLDMRIVLRDIEAFILEHSMNKTGE